ncbi:dynactin subunit 6 [Planococcus citri]|uniref:dynactin subunit 6 n=1 Tax=Planococcus citri TaxID=170843 RepID=UPI0031F874E6
MSKSEVKIYHGAVVCKETKIRGDVTIGSMTIVHPCATIIAESGPIVIGDGNIIEEQVLIINNAKNSSGDDPPTLVIGNNNVFEVGCKVESASVGDNNVLECKSYIGPMVNLGVGCVIGAGCRLTIPEQVPDYTLVYGEKCTRKMLSDKPPNQNLQRDFLTKMLPNYHHLKRSRSTAVPTEQQAPQE